MAKHSLYHAFKNYAAVKKLNLMKKLKMLHVGNMQNKTITQNNFSISSL